MEAALMKGSKKKRKHMQIMSRLDAMNGLANNNKAIIYGEQSDNLMANIETFKMVFNKWLLHAITFYFIISKV